jgi:ZIP family zinc transporter
VAGADSPVGGDPVAVAGQRVPSWLLALVPVLLIAAALGVFVGLGGPGLGERRGPPVEELAVEKTTLRPGVIELLVRNDGPDDVSIAQVQVNDAFAQFSGADQPIGRLHTAAVRVEQPWIEGEAYEVSLLTATGGTIIHEIPVAVATPETDVSFFALMALLGVYVGVIPIALGMLWLPWIGRISSRWLRLILSLSGVSEWLARRQQTTSAARGSGDALALLVAVGIGLHNLGEGVAIGAAYSVGALTLGAFLVVGFAIHNTTEGIAIVAPLANRRPSVTRLIELGLIAGAPAVLGAWIGSAAFNSSLAAFLFGFGAGAIVQVVVQLAPSLRDDDGRLLHPAAVGGLTAGMAIMFATGLLVSV